MSFTDLNPNDNEKYCDEWLKIFAIDLGVKYGAPAFISIINIIVSNIFKMIAPFELYYTKNDETASVFTKLTILQFINVAVVLLIQSLKFNIPGLNELHFFDGSYTDFNLYWYADIGS